MSTDKTVPDGGETAYAAAMQPDDDGIPNFDTLDA